MNRALLHRGPDDQAIYCNTELGIVFAFTRLALLDTKHGMQPMKNHDVSIILVYNGALYDYQASRKYFQSRGILKED